MIRLKDFSFTYKDSNRPALIDIDISVGRGEFVGIAGREGSGRTTLFRVLNGSAPRHFHGTHTGTASVGGINPCEAGHPVIGEFAASIFENPDSQIVSLTVEDEVGFALVQRGLPIASVHKRVGAALAATGLSGFENRATSSLSGGQKQRLVTATALALEPKLVLTDESASALDPQGSRDLYSLLSVFSRDMEITVIAIENDLELLMDYADRILVMNGGRIILDGRPGEIAGNIDLLKSAGVRIPCWLSTISILSERGLIGKPLPENEAAAVSILADLISGAGA